MPRFGNFETKGHKIYIYGSPREENPPHFHLVKNRDTVCRYGIKDFKNLDGSKVPQNIEKAVNFYWQAHKENMLTYFCQINPKLCESRE